jgi:nitrogen regulatory protein PII-like uncharacterized protein
MRLWPSRWVFPDAAWNRAGVCTEVSCKTGTTGMVDEDPGAAPHPYMKKLVAEPVEHEIRVLHDLERKNRLIVICPRLEEWLVQSAKNSGLKMTDFGFESDKGPRLHRKINHRLPNVERLVKALLSARSSRILRLQALIKPA